MPKRNPKAPKVEKMWTVFGFYESNGQTYCTEIEADSGEDAMCKVAQSLDDSKADLCFVGACIASDVVMAGDSVVAAEDYEEMMG